MAIKTVCICDSMEASVEYKPTEIGPTNPAVTSITIKAWNGETVDSRTFRLDEPRAAERVARFIIENRARINALRQRGGELEVRTLDDGGLLLAAYLTPEPIQVPILAGRAEELLEALRSMAIQIFLGQEYGGFPGRDLP